MRPLTDLKRDDIKDIKVICFDCDGVTVERGTEIEEKGQSLRVETHSLSDSLLKKLLVLKKHFHISFSSGRSLLYLDRMYGRVLWENASLQGENGIFTLINGQVIQHEKFSPELLEKIGEMKLAIAELAKTNKDIRGFEPKQFLITPHCWKEVPEIEAIVKKYDTKDEFYCIWNGEAYDIAPRRLNKGMALRNLAKLLKINIAQTMSIGNGPNDREMVETAGIGVTTDPKELPADFHTIGELHLGGEELVDKLLELSG
jgi:HAD superfamily hydrolase (TIGR01484 family)